MIAIIDYGMGNLRSVLNAFTAVGAAAQVSDDPAALGEAEAIVLPGVGAFGEGMSRLQRAGFIPVLEDEVRRKGKPLLGICLGMQLLATVSREHGRHAGLNWIPGVVDRLVLPPEADSLRIPHIGWNTVRFTRRDGLYAHLAHAQDFYFIHSYALVPEDPRIISGVCTHGRDFAASIEVDNLSATQYHPEKSHQAGLQVLKNWCARLGVPC